MSRSGTDGPDVLVVGGGIAGLTAGLRAAELGLAVTLLEQGADPLYPCNTRFSGGIVHAAYHDVNRPAEEIVALIEKATHQSASAAMTRAVATDGRRLLAWLRGHDIRFMRVGPLEAHRWCMAPPKPIMPGLEWRGRGPDVMLRTLTAALRARGGEVVLGARARELVQGADGRVRGVVVQGQRGPGETRSAGSVVIADGGFQGNAELFRRHIGPTPERVLQRGAGNGRGDGLAMAIAAGAATCCMESFYGHLQSRDALTDPRVWPYPELDAVAASALVVGSDGKRLLDEGLGGLGIANALARLIDPASAVLICDAAVWEGPGRSARFPANPFLERYGGTVLRAGSIQQLATLAGLPAEALRATVDAYNSALAGGDLAVLDPPRTTGKLAARPITQAPFLAIPLCAGITYTMGGMVVDGDGGVLRADGTRIAGLYAAGTTIGGLEGGAKGGHVGYVGGLIKSVFALRAAEDIARDLAARRSVSAAAD